MPFDEPNINPIDSLRNAIARLGRPRSLISAEMTLRKARDRRADLAKQRHDLAGAFRQQPTRETQLALEQTVAQIRQTDIDIAVALADFQRERTAFAPQIADEIGPYRAAASRELLAAIGAYQQARELAVTVREIARNADVALPLEPTLPDLQQAAVTLRRQLGLTLVVSEE